MLIDNCAEIWALGNTYYLITEYIERIYLSIITKVVPEGGKMRHLKYVPNA